MREPEGRWAEVDRIFAEALDVPREHRDAFVQRTCGGDAELVSEVRALLATSGELGGFLEVPVSGLTTGFWDLLAESGAPGVGPDARAGDPIGRYRVVRELARGGMGTVYLGERDDEQFQRQVAIKILRTGLETEAFVTRFLAERQIMASLDHPNIARLIDGGATEDGRPFLVLEYVEGTRIDHYCEAAKLSVEERIRLFLDIVRAVEHAHRHLVVHRDLKPSNVLVTDEGSVKLLDFGIAKILEESDLTSREALTRPEARLLTPEYAAPEQILGERARMETDIYALSAVLYELLTGVRPWAGEGRASVLDRVISGAEPTRPSEAVSEERAAGAKAEEDLAGVLSGDLDAILLQGLRSRPEERYGTVQELREELERYLGGYPVRARGDARTYRARRFISRHRAGVAATTTVAALLGGAGIGLTVQQVRVMEERDRAQDAAALAAAEAETSRRVTDFLVDLFEGSDPSERLGDTVTARFLLERGTAGIEGDLAEQPEVQADLYDALGKVYGSLGEFERSDSLLERAVEFRSERPHPDSTALAESLQLLARNRMNEQTFDFALPLWREALAWAPAGANGAELRGGLHAELGMTFRQLGEMDSAAVHLESGLELTRGTAGAASPEYLDALVGYAGLLRERGDHQSSEAIYLEALEAYRTSTSVSPQTTGVALNNLGYLRRVQGDESGAAHYYREALEVISQAFGRAHPNTLLVAGNLASAMERGGEAEGAILIRRESVMAAETRWPDGHWRLAQEYQWFGAALLAADRPEEAIDPLWNSVAMAVETIGEGHAWTRIYLGWYAAALSLNGREEEASTRFQQSLSSLQNYAELGEDQAALDRLHPLIDYLGTFGLSEEAARYEALLEE